MKMNELYVRHPASAARVLAEARISPEFGTIFAVCVCVCVLY